jgi:16S rRNA (uracil1498-N3)-methyltransferase
MPSPAHPWFHVPRLPAVGDRVTLEHAEAKHLHVRRKRDGDTVILFDGAGNIASASIVETTARRGATLTVTQHDHQAPPTPPVHLATALPKGDRLSTLIAMAVQLGVNTFIALDTERSVVRPTSTRAEARSAAPDDRLLRLCIESCKQSRRAWLPVIAPPRTPADLVADAVRAGPMIIAHPGGAPLSAWWREADATAIDRDGLTIVIGPEGGFTDDELAAMIEAGAVAVDLGPGILRIETAAVATLSALRLALLPQA